jgi:glucose-1-phosphate cytidylyltransferase
MKVIILAGGFGTRLSEYTENIPKPMVAIGDKPILWHIMCHFSRYGHKDFYLALGYKSQKVKEYFLNYRSLNSDYTINLKNGNIVPHQIEDINWNVTLVDTGLNSMTGGRVKRMKDYIGNEPFLLTYGDGLSNVDLTELIKFHKSHGKMVTVTAVHPVARFGELDIKNDKVLNFKEKPQMLQGWINGGFFVIEPDFFDFIENDFTVLEKEPLEAIANLGELMAYKHEGFWQCMDTKRDKDYLESLLENNLAPWIF